MHAYFQQKPLQEACKKFGVTLTAYAPLGSSGRKLLYEKRGVLASFTCQSRISSSSVFYSYLHSFQPNLRMLDIPESKESSCFEDVHHLVTYFKFQKI